MPLETESPALRVIYYRDSQSLIRRSRVFVCIEHTKRVYVPHIYSVCTVLMPAHKLRPSSSVSTHHIHIPVVYCLFSYNRHSLQTRPYTHMYVHHIKLAFLAFQRVSVSKLTTTIKTFERIVICELRVLAKHFICTLNLHTPKKKWCFMWMVNKLLPCSNNKSLQSRICLWAGQFSMPFICYRQPGLFGQRSYQ